MSTPLSDAKRLESAVQRATENVADMVEQLLAHIHAQSGIDLNFALTVYAPKSDYGNTITSLAPEVVETLFSEAVSRIKDAAAFNRAASHSPHGSSAIN